jgi:hypothetical protein
MIDLEVTRDGVELLFHATANRFYREAVGLHC